MPNVCPMTSTRQLTLTDFINVVSPQHRAVTGSTEHEMVSAAISLDVTGYLPGELETWEQIEAAAKDDPDLAAVVAAKEEARHTAG